VRSAVVLGGALALAVALGIASCLVDRKSSQYRCEQDADCAALGSLRVCDTEIGYCVPAECPAVCDECDVAASTCAIDCNTPGACGSIDCPAGWACTISCTANNACDSIRCAGARSCEITCATGNACDHIDCGFADTACSVTCSGTRSCDDVSCAGGPCDVTCSGIDACETVDCRDSCACDVACEGGSCARALCTDSACDAGEGCSTEPGGCDVCP